MLVLTAQDAVDAKVTALRAGADDYVTKPFAFEELLARVEALARRPRALASPVLRVGDLELDQATREVRRGGELIELTPKEYTVLEYLMRHAGRVMSRTLITEYAWGYHFDPGTNIVDVVINHLRKKIDAKHAQEADHHRARRRLRDQGVSDGATARAAHHRLCASRSSAALIVFAGALYFARVGAAAPAARRRRARRRATARCAILPRCDACRATR